MKSVIYCQGLQKSYGPKKILNGIDLEVPEGTTFALLGTNGAGKTTLIRTLLGLIPASGGIIKVLGEEPYKIGSSLRQKIGYVSEEQGLYGWMTVAGIIRFCKSLYQQWDDQLVQKYLERFKLNPNARIGTLSKGQTTKLALLLALAPRPELFILDEPMSGLDPLAQHEFLQVIQKEIQPEGKSVFFSTHNLADVEAVAQQVAIVFDGKIQKCGSIPEILQQIVKVKIGSSEPNPFATSLVLNEEKDSRTLLIPASEYQSLKDRIGPATPVSLHEAFLFYCSGGSR